MTRLEIGIVTLFGAIIIMLGSTIWTMMDLPGTLQEERSDMEEALRILSHTQTEILDRLEGK